MTPRFLWLSLAATATLALSLAAVPQTPAPMKSGPPLPSLAQLDALEFHASDTPPPAGAPDAQFLSAALDVLWSFRSGATSLEIASDPLRPRGAKNTAVYDKAKGGVVLIQATTQQLFGQPTEWSTGTGVILESGDVLTNWHVVDESVERGYPILVYLKPRGETLLYKNLAYTATVVGSSSEKDLARLRFVTPPPYDLVKLPIADISLVVVGEDIHVIGHPHGAKNAWSYSTGVVSQVRPGYQAEVETSDRVQKISANLVQVQTSINPGNSGGPILDDNAAIIALVSFGSGENLHFGIAADEIRKFLATPALPPSKPGLPSLLFPPKRGTSPGSPTNEPAARGAPPQPEFAEAALPDGRRVLRFDLAGRAAYLIFAPGPDPHGLVAHAPESATLEAWQFAPGIGFTRWRIRFPGGGVAEAEAPSGFPAIFSLP